MQTLPINQLTEHVIGRAFKVHNKLGSGFLENVYRNGLMHVLQHDGLHVEREVPVDVYWEPGVRIGHYIMDLVVENRLVLEIKAVEALHPRHKAQALNYLKATNLSLALVLNFGPTGVSKKRVVNGLDEDDG